MGNGNKTITTGKQQSGFIASKPDVTAGKGTSAVMALRKGTWSTMGIPPWGSLLRGISQCGVNPSIGLQHLHKL